jgi:retinol-binding protein 3
MKTITGYAVSILLSFMLMFSANGLAAGIERNEIRDLINSVSELILSSYVFPEQADKISSLLKKRFKEKAYDSITDQEALAKKLTEDIRSVNGDKHLRVIFNPEQVKEMRAMAKITVLDAKAQQDMLRRMQKNNFGFKEVKILDGNVGYMDLQEFSDTAYAGKTAVAAMGFLSNTDALIIDLRKNHGGYPSMIQLISSYLVGPEPIHLNSFYWRSSDEITQTWTLPFVPGKRRPDIDVYILTSHETFSAAEEFSYNLLNLERATLVGETTKGGAHPGGIQVATDNFLVWIPTGRAINPITNTNWEGVGIAPHIKVSEEKALTVAHKMAIEKLKTKSE